MSNANFGKLCRRNGVEGFISWRELGEAGGVDDEEFCCWDIRNGEPREQ